MGNRQTEWLKKSFKKLKMSFGNRCFECGLCLVDIEDLQFAHVKKTNLNGCGRGRQQRYYDIIKNPDAYFLCCVVKHSEIDNTKYYIRNDLLKEIMQVKNIEML